LQESKQLQPAPEEVVSVVAFLNANADIINVQQLLRAVTSLKLQAQSTGDLELMTKYKHWQVKL
jgi:hypothetical protein